MNLSRKVVVAALALGVAACGGKSENPAGGGPAGGAASTSRPGESNPSKGPLMDRFRIGRAFAVDGSVTEETATFSQGEPIHISFELKGISPGAIAKVLWTTDGGKKILGEEQKAPTPDKGFVSFTAKETSTWSVGDYLLLMQISDGSGKNFAGLGEKDFRIVAKKS
jgi:hypothetical protein